MLNGSDRTQAAVAVGGAETTVDVPAADEQADRVLRHLSSVSRITRVPGAVLPYRVHGYRRRRPTVVPVSGATARRLVERGVPLVEER